MGFLSRVEAASTSDIVYIEDIYSQDPQFKQLLDSVINLLYKFARKFKIDEDEVFDIFIKQLKKGM